MNYKQSLITNRKYDGTFEQHEITLENNGKSRTFKYKHSLGKKPVAPRPKTYREIVPIAHDHPDLALLPDEDFSGPEWEFDSDEFDSQFADMPSFDA